MPFPPSAPQVFLLCLFLSVCTSVNLLTCPSSVYLCLLQTADGFVLPVSEVQISYADALVSAIHPGSWVSHHKPMYVAFCSISLSVGALACLCMFTMCEVRVDKYPLNTVSRLSAALANRILFHLSRPGFHPITTMKAFLMLPWQLPCLESLCYAVLRTIESSQCLPPCIHHLQTLVKGF